MVLQWYVAKVKPRNERYVQVYLQRYNIGVYAPDIVVVKHGNQDTEPLFPGYVFIHVDPSSKEWPIAYWAWGVSYFLPGRQNVVPMGDAVIEDIRLRVERWNAGGWTGVFEPGERFRIVSGPLKGLDAILQQHIPGKQRCQVLISLMGRTETVEVGENEIQCFTARQRFAGAV